MATSRLGGPGWILGCIFFGRGCSSGTRAEPEMSCLGAFKKQRDETIGDPNYHQQQSCFKQQVGPETSELHCTQLYCASLKHSSCTGCISYRLREEKSQPFMRKPVEKDILISQETNSLNHLPTLKLSFSSSAGSTSVCLSRQRLTAWMPKLRTGWVRRNSEMELK